MHRDKSIIWKAEAFNRVADTKEWFDSFDVKSFDDRVAAEIACLTFIREMRKLIDDYEMRINMNLGQGA